MRLPVDRGTVRASPRAPDGGRRGGGGAPPRGTQLEEGTPRDRDEARGLHDATEKIRGLQRSLTQSTEGAQLGAGHRLRRRPTSRGRPPRPSTVLNHTHLYTSVGGILEDDAGGRSTGPRDRAGPDPSGVRGLLRHRRPPHPADLLRPDRAAGLPRPHREGPQEHRCARPVGGHPTARALGSVRRLGPPRRRKLRRERARVGRRLQPLRDPDRGGGEPARLPRPGGSPVPVLEPRGHLRPGRRRRA